MLTLPTVLTFTRIFAIPILLLIIYGPFEMTETTTQPRRGRPKKTASSPAQAEKKQAPSKKVIRRTEEPQQNCEYEVVKGGGIVTLLSQKGVTIYDEEKDTVREIRYCPNEPSIFSDEQGEKAKREAVVFRDKRLFVPKQKPQLRKFLDLHPDNVANGGTLFKRIDKKADAMKELQKEFLQTDAITMVRDKPIEELLPHRHLLWLQRQRFYERHPI